MSTIAKNNIALLRASAHCPSHSLAEVSARDLTQLIDEPQERGGTNKGFTPTETALSALIGCTNVIGHKVAASHGIDIGTLDISAKARFDRRGVTLQEEIEIPSLYFAHDRPTFLRDNLIWAADDEVVYREKEEEVESRKVRFRTLGDMSCTAAVESEADTLDTIIAEISAAEISERGARIDDKRSEAAMEKRKQLGYF